MWYNPGWFAKTDRFCILFILRRNLAGLKMFSDWPFDEGAQVGDSAPAHQQEEQDQSPAHWTQLKHHALLYIN